MNQKERVAITAHLVAGSFSKARAMIEALLSADPGDTMALAYLGAVRLELGESAEAQRDMLAAIERADRDNDTAAGAFAHLWLGYLFNRQRKLELAIHHFEQSAALAAPTIQLCAVLCQNYAMLGLDDQAKGWGEKSLALRAAEGQCLKSERVARKRPRAFNSAASARNVIAFSLFGDDPFYQECAVTIARSAPNVFPEFTCRFYCSSAIPETVMRTIAATGAKVLIRPPVTSGVQHPFSGTLWRFLAFDDPDVDVVLVRDVDSPFSPRERAAVDGWLGRDAPFFSMRDHLNHTEPLMAGLWGGFTGLLPRLGPIMSRFRPPGGSKYIDQEFLRLFIWPRIRNATLAIDSVYSLGETMDFPPHFPRHGRFHVGGSWTRKQILGTP